MVTAADIFTYDNQLIISKGTIITDKIITRLKFYAIYDIMIALADGEPEDFPDETVSLFHNEPYRERVKNTREFKVFQRRFDKSVEVMQGKINNVVQSTEEIDIDYLISDIKVLFGSCRNGIHLFDMIHSLRGYDDLTYIHSMNVALISSMIGTWLQMSKADINMLMLAAILHDIGKLTIPSTILKKPSRLSDEEYVIIKTHAMRGYNLLRPRNIDDRVKLAAMMHHERCDGTGYPLGLQGKQIHAFAKIVAIADVYDAMTSARVYRSSLCPFEVIRLFETEGLSMFDPRFIMTFLDHMCVSYLNNDVVLSNKIQGKIVMMNKNFLSKPVVQVGEQYIDLSKDPTLTIEALL